MKKIIAMALLILCVNSCSDEDISGPSSSLIYSLYSAVHHESEDCTGDGTNINLNALELTITLNNDLSYSYSLSEYTELHTDGYSEWFEAIGSSGNGNWADGTMNINGNNIIPYNLSPKKSKNVGTRLFSTIIGTIL